MLLSKPHSLTEIDGAGWNDLADNYADKVATSISRINQFKMKTARICDVLFETVIENIKY